jgi:polyisoprenoid-binding protein YceI
MLKKTLLVGLLFATSIFIQPLLHGGALAAADENEMTAPEKMPAGLYEIDKTHTSVTWSVSHLGLSQYTARFTNFNAKLNFDPKNPKDSTVEAVIDPTSIETDYPKNGKVDFNKKLAYGAEWFNSVKYPSITFKSTKIEMLPDAVAGGPDAFLYGDLTMFGISRPVILQLKFNGAYKRKPFSEVAALGFSASAKIKRSSWGFDTYVPGIGDEVKIVIEAEFSKVD